MIAAPVERSPVATHREPGQTLGRQAMFAVLWIILVAGSAGLPLTLVDGVTVATGSYPSRARLLQLAGRTDSTQSAPDSVSARVDLCLTAVTSGAAASSGGCCGGSGCC